MQGWVGVGTGGWRKHTGRTHEEKVMERKERERKREDRDVEWKERERERKEG